MEASPRAAINPVAVRIISLLIAPDSTHRRRLAGIEELPNGISYRLGFEEGRWQAEVFLLDDAGSMLFDLEEARGELDWLGAEIETLEMMTLAAPQFASPDEAGGDLCLRSRPREDGASEMALFVPCDECGGYELALGIPGSVDDCLAAAGIPASEADGDRERLERYLRLFASLLVMPAAAALVDETEQCLGCISRLIRSGAIHFPSGRPYFDVTDGAWMSFVDLDEDDDARLLMPLGSDNFFSYPGELPG